MFTGIVEETGTVEQIRPGAGSIELIVRAKFSAKGVKDGDSVAVNGCCLTVSGIKLAKPARLRARARATGAPTDLLLHFDLLEETWKRTNLQFAKPGALVNLERSLEVGGRLGGHFVTGHIDGTGRIKRWERSGEDHVLEIEAPTDVMRYVVFKGSICLDGISLTVASVRKSGFGVWIIPHTYEVTALRERKVGDAVNLEADMLGKYVEKFLGERPCRPAR